MLDTRTISSFGDGVYRRRGEREHRHHHHEAGRADRRAQWPVPRPDDDFFGPMVMRQDAMAQNGPGIGANGPLGYDVINGAVGLPGSTAVPLSGLPMAISLSKTTTYRPAVLGGRRRKRPQPAGRPDRRSRSQPEPSSPQTARRPACRSRSQTGAVFAARISRLSRCRHERRGVTSVYVLSYVQ